MASDTNTFALTGILLIPFFLPILLLCMLPSLIFGGYASPDGDVLQNMSSIISNMETAEAIVLEVLQEEHDKVLSDIEKEAAMLSPADTYRITDFPLEDLPFDAVTLISQFCASEPDYSSINLAKLRQVLQRALSNVFAYQVETTLTEEIPDVRYKVSKTITHYEYKIVYTGNVFMGDNIFHLTEEEILLASHYAQNLRLFLSDTGYGIKPNTELIPGATGSKAVELALTKLGTPYSQARRNESGYFDCSSFTYWVYLQLGINLSYQGSNTAAAQGHYIVENNLAVPFETLSPGDLIFYSFETNHRYLNISHVAIYCGNGYIAEASSVKGKVIYTPLSGKNSIVLCGRPYSS